MATNYPKLSYGSSGASVRQLQQALNEAGYALDVDGGFGPKTKAAVWRWTAWWAARLGAA